MTAGGVLSASFSYLDNGPCIKEIKDKARQRAASEQGDSGNTGMQQKMMSGM